MTPLELEEMTRELREARPEMDSKVAAELDEWAANGFARPERPTDERGAKSRVRPPRRRRWLVPAFGTAAAAFLIAGIFLTQREVDTFQGEDGSGTVEIEDAERGLNSLPATKQSEEASLDSGSSGRLSVEAPDAPDGRIQNRDTGLTLSPDEDEVDDVTGDAALIVQNYDGIVDEQTVSSGGSRDARGFVAARIPVQNLDAAVAEISDLADVKAMDQRLTDITKGFVTAEKRFATAKERVNSLLEQLAASDDPALREQLRVARLQLASARADLRAQKQEGNMADLTIGVVGEDGGWSIGDAADDAVGIFEWIGGALLVTLAVLIPAAALGAALWFGTRSLRRRRRESVLDE